ncbi:MAG TPA: non-homologous end-joining DNA ligase [Acidimicrobiales bacterium]|nr:non-homologous end-joining DNA ligase [Acidimicrobiales bacterium]
MPGSALPGNLEPMRAVAVDALPPDDPRWGYEVKWDGVRALAYVERGRTRLQSRTMKDITDRYPELAALGRELDGVVLDGEVVALDESGRPRFERLQQRINVTPGPPVMRRAAEIPVSYVAFDVLHHGGRPLLDVPYAERRALLAALALPEDVARAPRHHVGQGAALLQASRAQGLEGLVAKRLDGPYLPGRRSRLWLKVKNFRRQELVIGGWLPGSGGRTGALGALLVGHHGPGGLRYAGRVGTGFTDAELARVRGHLEALARSSSPFAPEPALPPEVRRTARFVEPVLVAEVAFSEWTSAGTLRAPSYKGLRDDVDPERVVREPDPPA